MSENESGEGHSRDVAALGSIVRADDVPVDRDRHVCPRGDRADCIALQSCKLCLKVLFRDRHLLGSDDSAAADTLGGTGAISREWMSEGGCREDNREEKTGEHRC